MPAAVDSHGVRAISVMRALADDPKIPGTAVPYRVLDEASDSTGFAILHNGGVTLAWAPTIDPRWPNVYMTSGLALGLEDIDGVINWVNQRNQQSDFGQYYWAPNSEGSRLAVLYEQTIWGDHFEAILDRSRDSGSPVHIYSFLGGTFKLMIETAAGDGAELVESFGGRRFIANDDDLFAILRIATGH